MTTRRRFYAPPSAFAPDKKLVTLDVEETRHARSVLRLQRGDEVYVFDGEGHEYRCRLAEFDRQVARLGSVEQVEPARPESPFNLVLAVALLKGEKFDLVVQKAAELGVSRVIPVLTARADVRLRDANEAKRKTERWQRIALESTKQCGRARVVEIDSPLAFGPLIDSGPRAGDLRLMFAERDGASFSALVASLASRAERAIALVGSEGGWTDDEITQARAQHWQILTLGGRTLRAETAAIAIATLLQHAFGDLV